jgi:ATP-dependent exoDNAse (exonuclease V) alpha subunit
LRLVLQAAPGVRVDQIRRQREGWMRDVVRDLMTGRAKEALAALDAHGRVAWAESRAAAIDAMVARWSADRASHPDDSAVLIARTHAEVRAINDRVRTHLRETGEIGPDLVEIESVDSSGRTARISLAKGDRIRAQRKLKPYGLINGSEATIERVAKERDGRIIFTALAGDRRIEIDLDRIADGRGRVPIGHAWAATLFSSQGLTKERAYVFGSPSFAREEAYVALSRARGRAELFLDASAIDRLEKKLLTGPKPALLTPAERLERLARRWEKPRGKTSALALAQDREHERARELEPPR